MEADTLTSEPPGKPTRPRSNTHTHTQKNVLFIIGDWNAKVGSQEIPGVTSKFGLGVQNEAGQKANTVPSREHTGYSKHPLPTTEETIHGHHQLVNIKIRLIIFFTAKDGEALYSQQKQD